MNNYSDIGMGNYYHNLSHDELIKKNKELRQIISDLRSKQDEYEKCTHTVYAPGKSYKELEEKLEKLEKLEQEKNQEIERLVNIVTQTNKEIQTYRQGNYNLKSTNINLEQTIEQQNVVITLAAGYISSTPQFSNAHPIDVKKWLIGCKEL
jgi:predicted RNase H-like nuclease (RuvC/YqgF family)